MTSVEAVSLSVPADVTVGFVMSAYSGMEGDTVSVCVGITGGTLDRDATLTISPNTTGSQADGQLEYIRVRCGLLYESCLCLAPIPGPLCISP